MQISLLQPTCIVGTKTSYRRSTVALCIHYNPRASWVLKRTTSNKFSNSPLLQPTCIVGTKTIIPQRSGSVKELQPTCIVGTKTFLFHSDSFAPIDYNPRTSRVLKPLSIHSATPTQTTAHVYCGD